MARIFLSYSLAENDLALNIQNALQRLNHSFEVEVQKPPAGRWRDKLLSAIDSADVIIPVLSDKGLSSNYVSSEIGSGRMLDKYKNTLLLPIIVASQFHVPSFVSDYHCFRLIVDSDGEWSDAGIQTLCNELNLAIKEHLDARSPRVFISHRHKDQEVVKALVALIETYFVIRRSDIRCTSVHPYRLSPGDRTSEKLKSEIKAAEVVLGILSPDTQESSYVLAELGAAWGCDVPTFPLLVRGATYAHVPSPLDERSCLDLSVTANCIQCVDAMSRVASLEQRAEEGDQIRIQEASDALAKTAFANF
jgi:hypothetical protein